MLVTSLVRTNQLWEIKINYGRFIKSKNLVLSSSLLAHTRCLEILNINSLPLRDAFEIGKDMIVDSLLSKLVKQEYIKRKIILCMFRILK